MQNDGHYLFLCKYTDEPVMHDACVKCREENPSQTYYC